MLVVKHILHIHCILVTPSANILASIQGNFEVALIIVNLGNLGFR